MDTLRLGLIGAGIQRSRTPTMHEEAAAHRWSCRYELFDLDVVPGGATALDRDATLYFPIFIAAGLLYPLALGVFHLLSPKMQRAAIPTRIASEDAQLWIQPDAPS